MSINDMLDSDSFVIGLMIFFLIVIAFAIPFGKALSRETNDKIYGNDEKGEIKTVINAKIIALRNSPHPFNKNTLIDKVVFQLQNGERLEFAIKDKTLYSNFLEGDIGELKYRGKQFIEFKRCI